MSSDGTDRPMTAEYGVRLTVTSAYGVHNGKGHHSCRRWSPEPESEAEAKELLTEKHGVVEVHDDVETREVPAPEKWSVETGTDGGQYDE